MVLDFVAKAVFSVLGLLLPCSVMSGGFPWCSCFTSLVPVLPPLQKGDLFHVLGLHPGLTDAAFPWCCAPGGVLDGSLSLDPALV